MTSRRADASSILHARDLHWFRVVGFVPLFCWWASETLHSNGPSHCKKRRGVPPSALAKSEPLTAYVGARARPPVLLALAFWGSVFHLVSLGSFGSGCAARKAGLSEYQRV
jgi:hypothetical protein